MKMSQLSLSEIDTEDVVMFFVHLTREDMPQSYNPSKKDTNILESSTTTLHDSLARVNGDICNPVKHVQMESEDPHRLEQTFLTHFRALERFEKQLLDWLVKDPAICTSTTPGNKRKNKGGAGDDIDKYGEWDGSTLTPTRSEKMILFFQSMRGNRWLNFKPEQVLETTS